MSSQYPHLPDQSQSEPEDNMSAPNKNMKFLSPLLLFTCILCTFPQFRIKNFQGKKGRVIKKLNAIFAVLCVGFWTVLSSAAIYKEVIRLNDMQKPSSTELKPVTIMSLILQCVLALLSCVIVVCFGFVHPKNIHELFKNLDRIDFMLDFKLGKTSWQICVHSLIFCTIQLVHGYYTYSLWKPVWGPNCFHIYSARIMQMFQFSLVVFTFNTLCLHLYQRFKRLNVLLKEFDPLQALTESRLHIDKHYKYFMFKELKKIHSTLCDQIDSINDIFGFVLLCFIVTAITMMCYFVVHILTLIMYEVDLNQTHRTQMVFMCSSGMLFIILEVFSLAWIGAWLASETSKTHKISYALLNVLPHSSHKGMDQLFKKELKMFALQSGFRQPFISTSGIFKVDFGILGAVISSVTSYIIVAQQFLND